MNFQDSQKNRLRRAAKLRESRSAIETTKDEISESFSRRLIYFLTQIPYIGIWIKFLAELIGIETPEQRQKVLAEVEESFNYEISPTPGITNPTNDQAEDQSYESLRERAEGGERFGIQEFSDVKMQGEAVDESFARGLLTGTPLTYEKLLSLKGISNFPRGKNFQKYVLPTMLLVARVLKERGFRDETFLTFFTLSINTLETESGCGENIITTVETSKAVGISQFIGSTARQTFLELPKVEQRQYQSILEARKRGREAYNSELKQWLLGSATFGIRMNISLLLSNYRKIMKTPGTNRTNLAMRSYIAYNSGPANLNFITDFYNRFPTHREQTSQGARKYLAAARKRGEIKGSSHTQDAIPDRLLKGKNMYWFKVQENFDTVYNKIAG